MGQNLLRGDRDILPESIDNDQIKPAAGIEATKLGYDDTVSELDAETVQEAIDKLKVLLDDMESHWAPPKVDIAALKTVPQAGETRTDKQMRYVESNFCIYAFDAESELAPDDDDVILPDDLDITDQGRWIKIKSEVSTIPFIALTDVPGSYTGQEGKVPVVKGTADGLEFGKPWVTSHPDLTELEWSESGHTMDGPLDMEGNFVNDVKDPVLPQDAVTKKIMESADALVKEWVQTNAVFKSITHDAVIDILNDPPSAAGYGWTTGDKIWGETGIVPMRMQFPTALVGYAVGYQLSPSYHSHMRKTTNGGSSWADVTLPTYYPFIHGMFWGSDTVGYVSGSGAGVTIYKTVDGGANWGAGTVLAGGNSNCMHFSGSHGAVGGSAYGAPYSDGYVNYTHDDGATWAYHTFGGENVFSVFVVDPATMLAGTFYGSIYKTVDGGLTWTAKRTGAGAGYLVFTIKMFNSILWATVGGGKISKSTDNGSTWTDISLGTMANINDIYFPTASVGYAVGDHGFVAKTTDGGATWYPIPVTEDVYLRTVYFSDALVGFADCGDTTRTTTTGGEAGGTLSIGKRYIIDISPTGDWGPHAGDIAQCKQVAPSVDWDYTVPNDGDLCNVLNKPTAGANHTFVHNPNGLVDPDPLHEQWLESSLTGDYVKKAGDDMTGDLNMTAGAKIDMGGSSIENCSGVNPPSPFTIGETKDYPVEFDTDAGVVKVYDRVTPDNQVTFAFDLANSRVTFAGKMTTANGEILHPTYSALSLEYSGGNFLMSLAPVRANGIDYDQDTGGAPGIFSFFSIGGSLESVVSISADGTNVDVAVGTGEVDVDCVLITGDVPPADPIHVTMYVLSTELSTLLAALGGPPPPGVTLTVDAVYSTTLEAMGANTTYTPHEENLIYSVVDPLKVAGVADPMTDQDVATKKYVDDNTSVSDIVSAESTTVGAATNLEVDSFTPIDQDGAIYYYSVRKTNAAEACRTGTIMAAWVDSSLEYNEVMTSDVGDTSAMTVEVIEDTGNIKFRYTNTSGDWRVRVKRLII
ncbi:MAG: hypothetical protein A2Y38_04240 [Spirochaetes bacterium GWB1_59_5]|nr:MAG: hypothetical protein A2Y38_04240 [Spirochaetes bacterium GWB1_59_5]